MVGESPWLQAGGEDLWRGEGPQQIDIAPGTAWLAAMERG